MIIERRSLITGASALIASGWLTAARAAESDLFPIVETAEGKVRGYVSGGIAVFKGLRYAASTAGANRFRPPQPLPKWAGVRDAMDYGNIAPQIPADKRRDYADLILNDVQPGGMGEDCLVLNLWTPAANVNARKPVMVRFHGGGFYGGSSNSPGSDGEMLARFGDCVVITVNHRLSSLGYLYLGDQPGFADSGAAGMADLVACLGWIKRNVGAFGGDPNRVMIFGQSGGGAKVSHLLGMPGAKGLFHAAGVMSGSRLQAMTREEAEKASSNLLAKLGLKRTQIKELQAVPFTKLLSAQADVEAKERAAGEAPRSFAPVLGTAIPHHPFDPAAPVESASIPIIVSSTLDERTYRETKFNMGWDEVRTMLRARVGADADKVLTAYRDEDPKATPFLINARVITDTSFRRAAFTLAERKAAQGQGKVWTYLWTHASPAYGGRYGAVHAVDVPYSMHDVRSPLAGPSAESLRLADIISSAWVALAAKADPNNPKTPAWAPYDQSRRMTLVIGDEARVVSDPRRAFREMWGKYGAGAPSGGSDA